MTAPVADRSLTLVIAGLFGPPGASGSSTGAARVPALATLLARAERGKGTVFGLEATIFHQFDLLADEEADLPVAAVTRVLDLGVIDKGWWLRADPVHLTPDRDRLILADAEDLDVTQEEATRLAAEIQEVYQGEGWVLKAPRPGRWYLKPTRAPRMSTTPLAEVSGRDIHPYLPKGKDGKAWHTVLNEIQIVLHSSKVNEERERRGRPPINSLWFWGGGKLPKLTTPTWTQLWSNEPVGLALARLAEVPSHGAPSGFEEWRQIGGETGRQLVVIDWMRRAALQGDADRWVALLERIEQDWFKPMLAALKGDALEGVTLLADTGQHFALTPRHVRRWWRRTRSLAAYR